MKKILFIAAAMTASFNGKAQITLEHTFNTVSQIQAVLLTSYGTKIATYDTLSKTVKLYNTDYTLWKNIPVILPAGHRYGGYNYISDKLFDLDDEIELLVTSIDFTATPATINSKVIKEDGSTVISFNNSNGAFIMYIDGVYKLTTSGYNTYTNSIYRLPGTLPCGHCGSLGIPKAGDVAGGGSVAAASVPNPGSDEVRIGYSLPLGVNSGVLVLSGVDGKVINSYPVSNRDSELKVNISTLPGGMYIYTLHAEGMMPATGKIVK